jgi:2-keto-4-pentenoate hydratase/2-oxohepta-3-ene-1,7-dioic acid hydratase in catechol pathway
MRLSTILVNGTPTPAAREGDVVRPIGAPSFVAAIARDPDPATWSLEEPTAGEGGALPLAPLLPGKIVAIGLNYRDHVRETGMDMPRAPLVIAKFPSFGDRPLRRHRPARDRPRSCRLGGRTRADPRPADAQRTVERALDGVFGYTVANDVSARDVQFGDVQRVRGKSFDTFCPVGPEIVTTDEIRSRRCSHSVLG